MRTLFLVFLTLIISQVSMADTTTPPLTIKTIGTGWTPDAIFIESNEESIVEGCDSARIRIDDDNPMLNHILSIALSAYHTSSTVRFRVKGCDGGNMSATSIKILD